MSKWASLAIELKREFPKFKIVEKETSKFMKFLFVISLMKYWNPNFMETFTTVTYQTVYMPKAYIGTLGGYAILRHEVIHMRDSRGWRALHFYLSYSILLPIGLCMRAYWEFRAYVESMKVQFELNKEIPDYYVDFIAKQFIGSTYLWMFPFPKTMRKLLNKKRAEIIKNG